MKSSVLIFYWGMLISFLGALPPGVMNITAIQIAGNQGNETALIYASGSMLVEVIIVRLTLSGMNWLTRRQRFFQVLEWITAVLLIAFSVACFVAAETMKELPAILPELLLPPFLTGMLISLINPLHIPFWMGWSSVLLNKEILIPKTDQYNWYVTGIAAGTMVGFMVYIFGGVFILETFQSNQFFINCIAGSALLITAILYVRKMLLTPAVVRHAKLFKQEYKKL
jgi:threonine/homoserine/homoserine lactone efflux protein